MKLLKSIGVALLLIALLIVVIPVFAQGPASPIPPEALKEKARLLAEYQKALDNELNQGETAISPEDGKTKMLVGNSAKKMDALWQETVKKIEAVIARPAAERAPIERMIAALDGAAPVYVSRGGFPYSASVQTETYQTKNHTYTVDIASGQILEIMPPDDLTTTRHSAGAVKNLYSQAQLKEKAQAFVKTVAGNVNLQALRPVFSNKDSRNYFFRWEDPAGKLPDGMTPFIQVSMSAVNGEMLNYVNTLPAAIKPAQTFLREVGMLPGVAQAYFQETYANGGGYWYWIPKQPPSGSTTTLANAGYCYIAGWCSPKNFFWAYTDATKYPPKDEPYVNGGWDVTPDSQWIYLKAFIPSTKATAFSRYTATYNNGKNAVTRVIDQEAYSNIWVAVVGPYLNYGVVTLDNNDDIATYKVAWDEVMLCTSGACP
ncbi:MAG: hypothetical protein WA821_19700 [Anaerolineales bacterium]